MALRQALLVAAGLGSRLRPLTDVLPKCLVPIAGRPLLGLWLEQLGAGGIDDVLVNTHHHAALVAAFVSAAPGVTVSYEPTLLGTAGTLGLHAERFRHGPVLFAHADNLTLFDLDALSARHAARAPDIAMTMMTFETDVPERCGIVTLDATGRVTAFHEKKPHPPGRTANAAVYVLEPEVAWLAARLAREGATDFSTDVIPRLIGRIQTFHNAAYHRDIGTPASLCRAQFEFPLALARAGRAMAAGDDGFFERSGRGDAFAAAVAAAYPDRPAS